MGINWQSLTNRQPPVRVERGSGTVLALAGMAVLLAVGGLLLILGWGLNEKQELQDSADLAALSGSHAYRAVGTERAACDAARHAAKDREMTCFVDRSRVSVVIRSPVDAFGFHLQARARAGPRNPIDPALLP